MEPDTRILDLFEIELPIVQAPMAGSVGSAMVIAVSEAGGLGSLPCAMLDLDQMRSELSQVRQGTSRPFNVNFFCHEPPAVNSARESAWRQKLAPFYSEFGLDPLGPIPGVSRPTFDAVACDAVLEFAPEVVSFHFGLPASALVERIKSAGAKVISSATSVAEALWLEKRGCDAIIAQGYEAGGHRGMFLNLDIAYQTGTMALVPQIADAVRVPVIAAGAIADARGIKAAFALGASAVQMGTAYLLCPEAKTSAVHRAALRQAKDSNTVLTNAFTGRAARSISNRMIREVGPMSDVLPAFPLAAGAVGPLRAKAETVGSGEFSPLWSGQAGALAREMPAGDLTRMLGAGYQAT